LDRATSLILFCGILRSLFMHDIIRVWSWKRFSSSEPAYPMLHRGIYVVVGCGDTFGCEFQRGG